MAPEKVNTTRLTPEQLNTISHVVRHLENGGIATLDCSMGNYYLFKKAIEYYLKEFNRVGTVEAVYIVPKGAAIEDCLEYKPVGSPGRVDIERVTLVVRQESSASQPLGDDVESQLPKERIAHVLQDTQGELVFPFVTKLMQQFANTKPGYPKRGAGTLIISPEEVSRWNSEWECILAYTGAVEKSIRHVYQESVDVPHITYIDSDKKVAINFYMHYRM